MLVIDAATRKIIWISPLEIISGRRFDFLEEGIVVIARENKEEGAHHLVLLDKKELKPLAISRENIFWRSLVEVRDCEIFAVIQVGGKFYLAKFNSKMERIAQSAQEVYEDTFISFYGELIYVSTHDQKRF